MGASSTKLHITRGWTCRRITEITISHNTQDLVDIECFPYVTDNLIIQSRHYYLSILLLEVCPSHPLYNPQLLLNATLDVEQVLDILSEFLVFNTSQDQFDLLEKRFSLADESTRLLIGHRPVRGPGGCDNTGDIPNIHQLLQALLLKKQCLLTVVPDEAHVASFPSAGRGGFQRAQSASVARHKKPEFRV